MSRALPSALDQGAHEILTEHDPQGTVASVRNMLAEQARGDYLVFLDADDELERGYIAAMKAARPERDTLLTPAVSYVVHGRRMRPKFWPEVDLRYANWLVIGTAISRSLFWEIGGFSDEEEFGAYEDWELWLRASAAGATVRKVPDAIYVAHQEPTSRHRSASQRERARWHYAIGSRHYPEIYDDAWKRRNGIA